MNKIFYQLATVLIAFFSTWFVLNQVDYIKQFNLRQLSADNEYKLGNYLWTVFSKADTVVEDDSLTTALDSIKSRICRGNGIIGDSIKIHVLKKSDVNAFALPGNHLIIYSGLIAKCDNAEELAGVMSHEIAHMQLHHVTKKLMKEIGLSLILSTTTGNTGGELLKEIAKLLSSSAYDRSIEGEADRFAVTYMINAHIDPEPFAEFMIKLSEKENDVPDAAYWISTHPESKERAKVIRELIGKRKFTTEPIMSEEEWTAVKGEVE